MRTLSDVSVNLVIALRYMSSHTLIPEPCSGAIERGHGEEDTERPVNGGAFQQPRVQPALPIVFSLSLLMMKVR